jgi:hypothetical protein
MEYGDWPGAGKGLPLQGNVVAVTWEGSGKAVKAHRGVLLVKNCLKIYHFLVPFALYLQLFGTRTCHFAMVFAKAFHFALFLLDFGMFTFHFAWHLLHFGMFTFYFVRYLLHFGTFYFAR